MVELMVMEHWFDDSVVKMMVVVVAVADRMAPYYDTYHDQREHVR